MSDILAQMSPEAAQRLTVALAARPKDNGDPADLPKIEGRPVRTDCFSYCTVKAALNASALVCQRRLRVGACRAARPCCE